MLGVLGLLGGIQRSLSRTRSSAPVAVAQGGHQGLPWALGIVRGEGGSAPVRCAQEGRADSPLRKGTTRAQGPPTAPKPTPR